MYIFMHCLDDPRCKDFATAIEHGAAQKTTFLIPSLLIHYNLDGRLKSLNEAHDDIYNFERKLGIRYGHKEGLEFARTDFGSMSKALNAISTHLVYMGWSCQTTTRQLEFLDDVAEKYNHLAVHNGFSKDEAEVTKTTLLENQA